MTSSILVIRLGAMGDILHALPAVASLRRGFPHARIHWAVEPRWRPLLEGNPTVDEIVSVDRRSWGGLRQSLARVRSAAPGLAVDLQGLWKSALTALLSGARERVGFTRDQAREPMSTMLYTKRVSSAAPHVVDQYLDIALGAGAQREVVFHVPDGAPEGELPSGPFVLANPLAGWVSKQWPMRHYAELAELLDRKHGVPLVLNVPEGCQIEGTGLRMHYSGLPGLIDATRKAVAVVGVDSGPLHLAAALNKPGVAIFGPTDPARNGPYGGSIMVLRDTGAQTTYRRGTSVDPCMEAIRPSAVFAALEHRAFRGIGAA